MPSPDLFTSLFVRHERQLYGFIAAMLGQPTDADDLLQETAKKLWREFDRYDPEKSFLGWAQTLARYEVLNYWQRQKTRRKYFSDESVELLAAEWVALDSERDARAIALEACVEALPADSRRLLEDRYSTGESLKETAQRTGVTPNSLYKTLQRIRKSLLDCVNGKISPSRPTA